MAAFRRLKLEYSERAVSEISGIVEYLRVRNPHAAQRVALELKTAVQVVAQFPYSGRDVGNGIRVFPVGRYPYLIYWTIQNDIVSVLHVRHTSRTPWPEDVDPA